MVANERDDSPDCPTGWATQYLMSDSDEQNTSWDYPGGLLKGLIFNADLLYSEETQFHSNVHSSFSCRTQAFMLICAQIVVKGEMIQNGIAILQGCRYHYDE